MPQRTPHRLRRWAIAIAIGSAALLALVLGSARIFLHGDDLGDFVAGMLNQRMRGRIEIGAVEWPMSSIPTMISGGWVPVTIRDVRLWDDCMQSVEGRRQRTIAGAQPSSAPGTVAGTQLFVADLPCAPDNRRAEGLTPRKKLLETAVITAEIDVHALFFGNHDLTFRNVRIRGGEVLLEQSAEPYPLHDYDKTTISLIAAFQPRMKAGFRAGIFADKAPPIFDLRDIHLERIGLTYHHRPELTGDRARYPITLRVENVTVDRDGNDPKHRAFLYADNSDPLVGKLYLSVPVTAGPATVRIDEEGPAEDFELGPLRAEQKARRQPRYIIDVASIEVERLAQLPRRWLEGDPIARTLELRLTARTAQGGVIKVGGEIRNWWDRPFDGTWALDVEGADLGPTVNASIDPALSGDHLTAELKLRGPFIANPKIEYRAKGLQYEALRPKELTDPPSLRLFLAQLNGEIDLVNDQGHLDETIAQVLGDDGQPSRGKIQLDATFGLKPYQINNADIKILEAIDLGRFLPESVRRHLGRYVRGNFSGNGDTTTGFALRNIDLVIGQRPTDVTARLYGGRIFTTDNFSTLKVARDQPLRARVGETSTSISGDIFSRDRKLDLKLANLESPDLGRWLRRLGVTAVATSATGGAIEISGPMTSPAIDATALLSGIPMLGQAQLSTRFEDQTLQIKSVQSATLGGSLTGRGTIRLTPGGAPYVESLSVSGQKISAEKMAAAGGLVGKASGTLDTVELSVRGSLARRDNALDWIDLVDAYIQADRVTVGGDLYEDIGVCVSRTTSTHPQCRRRDAALADATEAACDEARRKGGSCVVAHATRQDGGDLDLQLTKIPGALMARNRRGPSPLAGSIDVSALPLKFFDRFTGTDTFGGTVGGLLTIGGTADAPTVSGTIELLRAWAMGSFLGDSKLTVTPIGRTLQISGTALGGHLTLRATVGTAPPFPADLVITGRRIELDPLLAGVLPAMRYPLRLWTSGELRARIDLSPQPGVKGREPEAWIELSELQAIVDYRDGDQPSPLRFTAVAPTGRRAAVSVRLTPESLELVCPASPAAAKTVTRPASPSTATTESLVAAPPFAATATTPCPIRIVTPAGALTLSGSADLQKLELLAESDPRAPLNLALLKPLVSELFDELSGKIAVRAQLGGTLEKPEPEIELRVADIRARPTGLETVVQMPTGLLRFANSNLGFTNVRFFVDDTHLREGGELTVGGSVVFKDIPDAWLPTQWALIVTGKIPGKMLQALAPQAISQAGGLATIDQSIAVTGKGLQPSISGTLLFDPAEPLTVIPRGLRRELAFLGGSLTVETGDTIAGSRTYEVSPDDVTATIDGEGTVRHIFGTVLVRNNDVVKAEVKLDAEAIPFRMPGSLDLLLTGRDLELSRDSESRPWRAEGSIEIVSGKYVRDFDVVDVMRPSTPPAGTNRPFWEERPEIGNAALNLRVGVRQMAVENNIANIDLSGELVVRGTPRDPRINGTISVQRGTFRFPGTRASFTRTKGSVDFTQARKFPEQSPTLLITSEADYRDPTGRDHLITAKVSGPLSKPEWDLSTSTGYNKSQTLALLVFGRTPDELRQSIGDSSVGSDPTRVDPTTNPSAGAADQLIKDFAGNWVSLLLGNSLEELTGLDVLRFQVDFGSIGLRGEKRVFENVRGVFDLEQTVYGSTVNARVEVQTPYRVTLEGAYLNKNFDSEAEEDIRDRQLKLVYRFFIP